MNTIILPPPFPTLTLVPRPSPVPDLESLNALAVKHRDIVEHIHATRAQIAARRRAEGERPTVRT